MTQAPFVIRGARTGLKLGGGRWKTRDGGLTDTYCGLRALTAERHKTCQQHNISRKDADAYAMRSQQAAEARTRRAVQGRE